MASRAAMRALLPRRGFKQLIGPGAARFQVCEHHHTPGTNNSPPNNSEDKGPYVTVRDYEKFISEITLKHDKEMSNLRNEFEKAIAGQKHSFDLGMVALRYELKKDADEKTMKHYLDAVNAKNEVKSLEERFDGKFKEHELKIELHITKGDRNRLKRFGWFFGASAAFLSRFTNLPVLIFKNPKGSP